MADKRILIATLCDECALNVTATAPETSPRDPRISWPGWVSVSLLSTHDTDARREPASRLRGAWNSRRGRPAPWLHFATHEELRAYVVALERAGAVAFPEA